MATRVTKLLDSWREAYEAGKPLVSDDVYDYVSKNFGYEDFGHETYGKKIKHLYPLYSLEKFYDDEKAPINDDNCIKTLKIDGAAIALLYYEGCLVQAGTRGRNGIDGEDILRNVELMDSIPKTISVPGVIQVAGEVVTKLSSKVENRRNFASGAIRLKDSSEFPKDDLVFVAYSVTPTIKDHYADDMHILEDNGFTSVLWAHTDEYPSDGYVFRINLNYHFNKLGTTAKHYKGAYARKLRSAVEVLETTLREVIWQVGRTGKVTPVAIFDEIVIEDARITKATLHNAGFIEDMELDIGDTILVTRAGGVIPKVVGVV